MWVKYGYENVVIQIVSAVYNINKTQPVIRKIGF